MRMLKKSAVLLALAMVCLAPVQVCRADVNGPVQSVDIPLQSFDRVEGGLSWGVPFLPGETSEKDTYVLVSPDGSVWPTQSWTLAGWSDGSPKWLGFAAAPEAPEGAAAPAASLAGGLDQGWSLRKLSKSEAKKWKAGRKGRGIALEEAADAWLIDNGLFVCEFPKAGATEVLRGIRYGGREVAGKGRLEMSLEDRSRWSEKMLQYRDYLSHVDDVCIEQSGPVRATVRVDGHFERSAPQAGESVADTAISLPFTLRFHIYENSPAIGLVHTFVFDGRQECDFIRSLGLSFEVPMREELYNRHVVLSGDSGLWHEPVQPLTGRRVLRESQSLEQRRQDGPLKRPEDRNPQQIRKEMQQQPQFGRMAGPSVYHRQMACERIAEKDSFDPSGRQLIEEWASWDAFKLNQWSADGFTLQKRTQDRSPWLFCEGGNRSSGFAMLGDVSGGLAVSLKDFWQSYPAALEIEGARSDCARLYVWLWSPDAPAMDLRHYDVVAHGLNSSYEDVQEGLSTPYGISRTHSLTLYAFDSIASRETLKQWADRGAAPGVLLPTPEYLHGKKAFGGLWSLPADGSASDTLQWVERQLDDAFAYYHRAVEDNRWYGFWNWGDVMHTYDSERHSWLYDVGGFAWDNTELAPEMWLWYSFLRSGRPDMFRMAEAMSRHTSEVDVYHMGSLKGLGSRHNVSHWGCGAKEARIGQAAFKRFYAYLTADERMADLMHESADADFTTLDWDPLRIAMPRSKYPTAAPARLRWGPDWVSFAGNWFIEWERSGNRRYLDKLYTGFESFARMKNGLFTSPGPLGYYPETGRIIYDGADPDATNSIHLATIMGGFEILTEMLQDVEDRGFMDKWTEYCIFYSLPEDDPMRTPDKARLGPIMNFNTPRLTAYAAWYYAQPEHADAALAQSLRSRAWTEFLQGRRNPYYDISQRPIFRDQFKAGTLLPPETMHERWENPSVSTNGTSQWCLNAIFLMELLK